MKHDNKTIKEGNEDNEDSELKTEAKKRPRPTKEQKEYAINLHKTHLLTLIANGVLCSRCCEEDSLQVTDGKRE
jgi:hypothetical protein